LLSAPAADYVLAFDSAGFNHDIDVKNAKDRPLAENAASPLAFTPDGKSVFLRKPDGDLLRCRAGDHDIQATHKPSGPCRIEHVALRPDGKTVALGMIRSSVFLWDAADGKLLSPTDVPSGAVSRLAFSEKGELFITAENGHLAWWNPRTGVKLRDARKNEEVPIHTGARETSPDGRWLAVRETGKVVVSRADKRGGRAPAVLTHLEHEFTFLAISPDNRQLACAVVEPFSSPENGPILIYEMSSKKVRLELPGHFD